MAVSNIEYKKILKDADYTPTKLKDIYVSNLNNDSFGNFNKKFAESTEERYTIMTPDAASAMIASRKPVQTKEQSVNTSEYPEESNAQDETKSDSQNTATKFTPIQGGTWMPITIDETNTEFTDAKDFTKQMIDVYSKALQQRGLDPEFAKYIVAQDGLESGWGRHQSGKNNFGGIKGKGTSNQTKEWDGSKMVTITDSFRDFNSLEDYVNYKIDLVGNKRYNVFAYSPEEYFDRVKAGGYATDPNYVNKMNSVLKTVEKYV